MKTTVKQPSVPAPNGLAARATGFTDLLPGPARRRRGLEDRMLATFASWGYELVETPAVELLSTLELGVEAERVRRLFKFSDGDGRMLAMVGERTVPVARLAAGQLRQAPLPLRLCYLGPTFEGHPAPGSGRQSFQAGAELIGTHSAAADAEVVAMAITALEAVGLGEFQVEVGHVGFFGGLIAGLQPEPRARVLDALGGRDLVQLEKALAETDLRAAEQELLLRFPALRGDPGILGAAVALVDNPVSEQAVRELHEVHDLLVAHGVSARVNLDLGAVRDFDYYTGIIFEVFSPGLGAPLAAGGRYDGLLERFGLARPATGLVVFVDRVQSVLTEGAGTAPPELVLVGFEAEPAAAVELAASLRRAGTAVVMEVAASSEAELRRRAPEVGADRVVLCAEGEIWLLDRETGARRPYEPAP
jgi:ATP phosphoribosyltransferase regulatory subunit